eukprot:scaffold433_cov257-Pinguiococcus_pyrenoidosus.AAC.29
MGRPNRSSRAHDPDATWLKAPRRRCGWMRVSLQRRRRSKVGRDTNHASCGRRQRTEGLRSEERSAANRKVMKTRV